MKKIALLKTGNRNFFGYKKILDQEKIPHKIVSKVSNKFDLMIIPSGGIVDCKSFKGKVVKLNGFSEKAVKNYLHYKNYKIPTSFLRILVNKFFSRPVKQISLREQRIFLRDKIESLAKIRHVNYWPKNYKAAFCLRIDVDFPIRYFYRKKKILKALLNFKKELDNLGIKASLFLNLKYLKEAKVVKAVFREHDIQLHGCSKKVPHRRYGYDLKNISYADLYEMLKWGKEITGAEIFAPPCEQVDKRVLEICEKLGFKAVSAGHLGKDDVPYKCVLDREYELYNIPTSSVELQEGIPLSYYLKELGEAVKDNSLFCIYFHPILLLKKKKKVLALLKKVKELEEKKNLWVTTQKELVEWWSEREKS